MSGRTFSSPVRNRCKKIIGVLWELHYRQGNIKGIKDIRLSPSSEPNQIVVEFTKWEPYVILSKIKEISSTQGRITNDIQTMQDVDLAKIKNPTITFTFKNKATDNDDSIPTLWLQEIDNWKAPKVPKATKASKGKRKKSPAKSKVEATSPSISQSESAAAPSLNVPYDQPGYFVEPSQFLSKIRAQLGQKSRCVIFGLGGMGKTQTAVEYACRFHEQKDYEYVFWVTADTESNLRTSFRKIVRQIGIIPSSDSFKQRNEILRWLETNEKWLLIFDNANPDHPEWLRPFIPKNPSGHVLITSRRGLFDAINIADPLALPLFTEKEAMRFWKKRLPKKISTEQKEKAAELAETLGYLPLAMEQAGALLSERQIPFSTYLSRYLERFEELNSSPAVTGARHKDSDLDFQNTEQSRSVFTTWSLNFDAIAQESPASADLLYLSAFLAPNVIPYRLIAGGADHLGEKLKERLPSVSTGELAESLYSSGLNESIEAALGGQWQNESEEELSLQTEAEYVIDYLKSLEEQLAHHLDTAERIIDEGVFEVTRFLQPIERYSLVRTDPNKETYTIHRLVQNVLRHNLTQKGEITIWLEQSTNLVASAIEHAPEVDSESKFRLTSQAERIVEIACSTDYEPASLGILIDRVAQTFERQKRYSDLEPYLRQLLRMYKRSSDKDELEVADVIKRLADCLFNQGDYKKAEKLYVERYEITQEVEENEMRKSLFYADYLTSIAGIYHKLGNGKSAKSNYKSAQQIYNKLLKGSHKILPTDTYRDDFRLISQNLKKEAFYQSGDYSFHIYDVVLKNQKTIFGENSLEIVSTITDMSRRHLQEGRVREALRKLKDLPDTSGPTLEKIESMLLVADAGQYIWNYWVVKEALEIALENAQELYGTDSLEAVQIQTRLNEHRSEKTQFLINFSIGITLFLIFSFQQGVKFIYSMDRLGFVKSHWQQFLLLPLVVGLFFLIFTQGMFRFDFSGRSQRSL